MKRLFAPLFIILAVFAVMLISVWYLRRSVPLTSVHESSSPVSRAREIKLGAEPPHLLGSVNAPVMLEEFGDFACPPCGLSHPALKTAKKEFGSQVVIVFREFPLAGKHPNAMAAARAAEAAGLQGKFWEMHDLLYENQQAWREVADVQPVFEKYAAQIGLNPDRFQRDSLSENVSQRIALDRERGSSIGVNSTPTVFLNGREVPVEALTIDKLRELIKTQLPRSQS